MITDTQLGTLTNFLGVTIFVLVIVYHYIVANPPKAVKTD
uniref:Dolichyl-diphosphooligosaccharide--protein glycosyltransferase subunit 4 n=1 Tax=Rhabditophanes sp. KR3021 TaxID=114890 RepID=A0AC35TI80_9BILA